MVEQALLSAVAVSDELKRLVGDYYERIFSENTWDSSKFVKLYIKDRARAKLVLFLYFIIFDFYFSLHPSDSLKLNEVFSHFFTNGNNSFSCSLSSKTPKFFLPIQYLVP